MPHWDVAKAGSVQAHSSPKRFGGVPALVTCGDSWDVEVTLKLQDSLESGTSEGVDKVEGAFAQHVLPSVGSVTYRQSKCCAWMQGAMST